MAKRGLGKGLGALFGEEVTLEENVAVREEKPSAAEKKEKEKTSSGTGNGKKAEKIIVEKIVEKPVEQKLKVSLIEPNGTQPRKNFDEGCAPGAGRFH